MSSANDRGQLENIKVEHPYDMTYEFNVNWYSGANEKVPFTLTVTRKYCGEYLSRSFRGQSDKQNVCGYKIEWQKA